MEIIYLDMVLALNFLMDWLLLRITAYVLKLKFEHWRLFLGAFVGALYTVFLLFPLFNFFTTFSFKLIFSLIMIGITFKWKSGILFFKTFVCFYLVSFLTGGGMMGILYFLRNLDFVANYNGLLIFIDLPFHLFFASLFLVILLGYLGIGFFKKNNLKQDLLIPTTIYFADKTISTTALLDTGNHLKDPISRRPVIIMEASLFEDFLPKSIFHLASKSIAEGWGNLPLVIKGTAWEKRLRLLPFYSLGAKKSFLLGLIVDGGRITEDGKILGKDDFLVGLYPGNLCPEKSYRALLHAELLERGNGFGKEVAS